MPFRFRRSISLTKGIKLNLSKRGTSLSLGGKGASINLSKRGTRTTVGIPGTGISYSEISNSKTDTEELGRIANSGKTTWLDWVSLFTQGANLIISVISLLVGCLFLIFIVSLIFTSW